MSPISPTELNAKIEQTLDGDPRLRGYELKARAYDGGLVQIQGIVDVLDEKRQAEELIWRIPGVKRVENNITVCTDGGIDDGDVAFEVSEELRANPEIPDSVGVAVSGGAVRLVGSAGTLNQMEEAVETAGMARGVKDVKSELKLTDTADDATINNQVQRALLALPELRPGWVKSLSRDGVVTLWGNVPKKTAVLALETAAGVPGVKRVINSFNRGGQSFDDRIVIRMMEIIAANPYLNEQPIEIEVEDGKIGLSGWLDSLEAKRDIEALIQRILNEFHLPAWMVENRLRLKDEAH